jgi:hypothetical protein
VTQMTIRGFIGGVLQFEEQLDGEAVDLESLAEGHGLTILALPGGDMHMIEIEFMDEPDPLTRFFRFGTDTSMMVMPMAARTPEAKP